MVTYRIYPLDRDGKPRRKGVIIGEAETYEAAKEAAKHIGRHYGTRCKIEKQG